MPKLLSGEAFPAFRNPAAIAIDESIPGLVFKLKLFGVPYMGFAASRALGWIYTVVALALTARLALQPVAAAREPLAWLTILILATMRSPFSAHLCAVPIDVVGNAAGRARVGPIAGVHDVSRCLERTRLHIRDRRCATARERDLDVRAHGRCLRPRGNRRPMPPTTLQSRATDPSLAAAAVLSGEKASMIARSVPLADSRSAAS